MRMTTCHREEARSAASPQVQAFWRSVLLLALLVWPVSQASAQIVLSQVIVELQPGKRDREDIEIFNNSPDRAYVVVEPSEIIDAGRPGEKRVQERDPATLGLLVAPSRVILEPGQHKLLRVAAIAPPSLRERVYRLLVKPVVGEIASTESGLKLLVGYDVLILVRPAKSQITLYATRSDKSLTIRNDGNSSVELSEGKHCDATGKGCVELPGKRLYAGAEWRMELSRSGYADFTVRSAAEVTRRRF